MDRCTGYEGLIEKLLAEEIDGDDRERLLAHAERCADCRAYVDLHVRLLGSELDSELPDDRAFAAMRAAVLDRVRNEGRPRGLSWLRWPDLRPAAAIGTAAVLILALATGLLVGRITGGGRTAVFGGIATDLHQQARQNLELSDVEQAPYRFTNVQLTRDTERRLTLRFDVTRHMELTRPEDDPLVKEILVQSLVNESPVGTRLEALTWAEREIDPKVKQALLVTALNDPSQAVRLKALDVLATEADDPDVQAAMLAILDHEDSVQMRLRAIDHLAASSLSPDRLRQAIDDLSPTDDRALIVRAARYDLDRRRGEN